MKNSLYLGEGVFPPFYKDLWNMKTSQFSTSSCTRILEALMEFTSPQIPQVRKPRWGPTWPELLPKPRHQLTAGNSPVQGSAFESRPNVLGLPWVPAGASPLCVYWWAMYCPGRWKRMDGAMQWETGCFLLAPALWFLYASSLCPHPLSSCNPLSRHIDSQASGEYFVYYTFFVTSILLPPLSSKSLVLHKLWIFTADVVRALNITLEAPYCVLVCSGFCCKARV